MKIDGETSLGQLEVEASKLGVTSISVQLKPLRTLVGLHLVDDSIMIGEGPTIDRALDQAFTRLRVAQAVLLSLSPVKG